MIPAMAMGCLQIYAIHRRSARAAKRCRGTGLPPGSDVMIEVGRVADGPPSRYSRSPMRGKFLGIFVLGTLLGGASVYGVLSYQHSSGPFRGDTGRPGVRDATWARPLASQHVRNFHQVSAILYRGAQPDHNGFVELEKLGIKTVVNLRLTSKDDGLLNGTRLSPVAIPAEPWDLSEAEVVAFLRVLSEPARLPVFVHCSHGADRTGAMTALYRVAMQGWTKDAAIQEMTEGGFGYHTIWNNLPDTIRSLDIQALKEKAGIR